MNRSLRFSCALLAFALAIASTTVGCGSSSSAAPDNSTPAGSNKRLKYKEDYKKMLGKDGKMLWKPSESNKRPAGMPKS